MARYDATHVMINGATVVWDAVTKPDQAQDGSPKYSLKIVVPPQNTDMADMQALANETLQSSKFKGTLPANGRMPIGTATAQEFNGLFPGWSVLNCNTKFVPDVYDENGAKMEPMQYSQLLYPGQRVNVLVHCYEYDMAGNRGIATGLDGFAIVASAQAARIEVGGPSVAAQAFGGGGQPAQAAANPQPDHSMVPGAPPPPAAGGQAAPPPPATTAEPMLRTPDGGTYTASALRAAGWPEQQIATLPQA